MLNAAEYREIYISNFLIILNFLNAWLFLIYSELQNWSSWFPVYLNLVLMISVVYMMNRSKEKHSLRFVELLNTALKQFYLEIDIDGRTLEMKSTAPEEADQEYVVATSE